MRGGGGNFGVVVSFTYRLHPVNMVLAGPISYSLEWAADALRLYHQVASTAPDSLATAALVARGSDGQPYLSVVVCWSGPVDEGQHVLRTQLRLQRVINGCQLSAIWAPERLFDPFHESDKSYRY